MTARRPRVRDWGLAPGVLPPGGDNAITDVAGVRVGHATLISGRGSLSPGQGPVRTGVTVVLPHGGDLFRQKVRAAVHTINGFGKVCGFEQVRELGLIEAPVVLTNTLNVGLVCDAMIQYAIERNPTIGVSTGSINVVVGETNDGYLNDLQGRHVRREHVMAAIGAASSGPVLEGAVGAGTGTSCFGWKGGIGTASRVVPNEAGGFTVGALVQTNFGRPEQLVVCGIPVGRHLRPPEQDEGAGPDGGSVMIALATDAPLTARQLHRLCVRAGVGLARTGSVHGHGSGDFVIAFSTAHCEPHDPDALTEERSFLADEATVMRYLFPGVVEAVEEAVLNALWRADTLDGRDGHVRHALPLDEVARVIEVWHSGDRRRRA
jgi:D-aminopeptidase